MKAMHTEIKASLSPRYTQWNHELVPVPVQPPGSFRRNQQVPSKSQLIKSENTPKISQIRKLTNEFTGTLVALVLDELTARTAFHDTCLTLTATMKVCAHNESVRELLHPSNLIAFCIQSCRRACWLRAKTLWNQTNTTDHNETHRMHIQLVWKG